MSELTLKDLLENVGEYNKDGLINIEKEYRYEENKKYLFLKFK